MAYTEKYYLKAAWQTEYQEVTKQEWINAERSAGFRPNFSSDDPDYMTTCATGGFSSGQISGKIDHIKSDQEDEE